MSSTATAAQPDTVEEQPEFWEEFKTDIKPLTGAFGLLKEYYDALQKHGQLIGRPMVKEILEVDHKAIEYYLKRGRLTDVRIGPMNLVPVSEVLSIWKERHESGRISQKKEGHIGGKDGPLSNSEILRMVGGLDMNEPWLEALKPK